MILGVWISFFLTQPFVCIAQNSATIISTIYSPDTSIRVELMQKDENIFYRVYKDEQLVVSDSKLGISFSFTNFTKLEYVDKVSREIDETYTLPSGKMSEYRNRCNEQEVAFTTLLGSSIKIVFRVFNEGFAYRYQVDGKESGSLRQELSEVAVNDFKIAWSQKYNANYETTYNRKNWAMTLEQSAEGQGSPVLVETNGSCYLLLTEAANTGSYATSRLMPAEATGCYYYKPEGTVLVKCPFESPWRVVMLGTLNQIIESSMVEHLNVDADQRDWSWVRPGRASWNWGGEDAENVISWDIAVKYVDMAASMGWEYFILDDGWDSVRDGWNGSSDVKRLVEYAAGKSVGVLLWSHQNRFASNKEQINRILSEWKSWGVKGAKIDFWDGDAQKVMKQYDIVQEAAADLELLVNWHGCTRPSGTRRTWPNVLTSEAVYGGEMYLGNRVMLQPSHNVMLAMTRNVIGPMDYTPGEFGTKWGAVSQYTSWSHQLALLSLYESGIQCYVDNPLSYRYNIAESYLKDIPAAWDDVKCLEAEPESYVTLARRKGDDWYVSSICNQARTLSIPLDFLDETKTYYAYIYKDGGCKAEIAFDYQPNVGKNTTLTLPLLASGGASVRLSVSDCLPKPWQKTLEAEDAATFAKKEQDAVCSGGAYVSALGRSNKLNYSDVEVEEGGEYALTFFYMTDKEKDAYLKVNGGEEIYYHFPSSGGLEGKHLSFTTVLTQLESGKNKIEIGNASALMPNMDRITLKRVVDKGCIVGNERVAREKDVQIRVEGCTFQVITASKEAVCTLYSVEGQVLQHWNIHDGRLTETLAPGRTYIVNVYTGKESYSQKIIAQEK